jgi:hypothetical protein
MLNHFKSAIDKFFNNAGGLLKPVIFNLMNEAVYDVALDKKTKSSDKISVKCLCLEKDEANEKQLGMTSKKLEVICRVADFKRRIPTIFDFFEFENKTYNITEIVNDNGIYINVKGE